MTDLTVEQTVTTSSSSMTANPWAQQIPFDVAAEGQKFNFVTGMGGWSDIQFAYKQRNWVGKYAKIARLNFFGRNDTSGNLATSLSEEQLRTGILIILQVLTMVLTQTLPLSLLVE